MKYCGIILAVTVSVILALGLARSELPAPVGFVPSEQSASLPSPHQAIPRAHAWQRAQWHVLKRLGHGQTQLPMNALEPARKAARKMSRSDIAHEYAQLHPQKGASDWTALGPFQKGGRTRRIVFDSAGTMYAAGVSGGVWRYDGARWAPLGERLVNLNVGALALATDDDRVLYAGTGELYRRTNRPYSSMTGDGIFKSTNSGQDWVQLDATINDQFLYVSDIVVSPLDGRRLYAATNTGVWRSDNGGASFSQTLSTVESGGQRYEGCTDLAIADAGGADWLLATCASRSTDDRYYLPGLLPGTCSGPCDARVYLNRAANSGNAWNVVLTEPGMGRTSLTLLPGAPGRAYALAASTAPGPDKTGDGIGDYNNGLHGVFRSDDGGQTWAATVRNSDDDPVNTWMLSFAWQARSDGNTPYSAGWYNQAIVVDPIDPDVVWVGGMQLYRSNDAGHTFGLTSNYFANSQLPSSQGPQMHPDIHALNFAPDGRLWIGNDGGVWRATNQGAASNRLSDGYRSMLTGGVRFDPRVSNFTTTQFYHGSVSPDGQIVIGGMQDNGTDVLNLPGFQPGTWVGAFGGDGSYSAYDPAVPYYYFSAQNGFLARMDANYEFAILDDNLRSVAVGGDEFMFITPFELDPRDRSRIYLGGKRLFRGTSNGDQWAVASQGFGREFQDKANAIAVANNQPRVLVGTGNAIYRIDNADIGGGVNTPVKSQPRSGWVSSLAFDPQNNERAFATYSSFGGEHVWRSNDGGTSFEPIDGTGNDRLPDVPVHSIVVHPTDGNRLYIGTDLGVFVTADGGQTWQVEETGFGGAIVEKVTINEREDAGTAWLYAFTYGRGVWRAPLTEVTGEPDYAIGAGVNGLWYDSSQPGHGIQVQAIDVNGTLSLLVAWYVYRDGQPLWLIGVGAVNRDRAIIPMTITSGTGFGDDFVAADIVREDWGTLELVFVNDNSLSFRWQSGYLDGAAGTLSLDRLTRPVAVDVAGSPVTLCSTGVYYNPAQDGHGIIGETVMQDGQPAFAWTWFNYRNGQQLWLVGSGRFDGNRVVADAYVGAAGEFPPRFDANSTQVDLWGTVEFTFTDEREFALQWTPADQPETPGTLSFTQLSTIAESGCN